MQEFESISASSYDPSALATKLTAKAADGWSVVAIVPTGGDVTAFVTREKSSDGESPKATDTSEPATASGRGRDLVVRACQPRQNQLPTPRRNRRQIRHQKQSASQPAGQSRPSRRGRRRRILSPPRRNRRSPSSRGPAINRRRPPATSRRRRHQPHLRRPRLHRRRQQLHRRRRPPLQFPPAGMPTRPDASNCATGTAARGPSTCLAPASSSPTRLSPDRTLPSVATVFTGN